MLRQPPEILITTPESLNLLLSSQGGRGLLTGLRCVILDEIHAVVGSKRGVHLITAVERLVRLSGEFQRISLSATVRPLDRVAAFVGGFRRLPGRGGARYEPRPVAVLRSAASKRYDVSVRYPEAADAEGENQDDSIWPAMAEAFEEIIAGNRSTCSSSTPAACARRSPASSTTAASSPWPTPITAPCRARSARSWSAA